MVDIAVPIQTTCEVLVAAELSVTVEAALTLIVPESESGDAQAPPAVVDTV